MNNLKLTAIAGSIATVLSAGLFAGSVLADAQGENTSEASEAAAPEAPSMLLMPIMEPSKGRVLFAEKGCVVCHSINGVGGEDARALDAEVMTGPVDAFEFAARMWRGAPAMIMMQEDELGAQIELTGPELADIIAFVHNAEEQAKFSEADIPEEFLEILEGGHD